MNFELIRPAELGASETRLWSDFQTDNAVLASPFLSPAFATAIGALRAGTRVAIFMESGTPVGFLPLSVSNGFARAVAPGFANCEGMVHGTDFDWSAARKLLSGHIVGWRYDKLLADQAGRLGSRNFPIRAVAMDFSAGWSAYRAWAEDAHAKTMNNVAWGMRKLQHERGEVEFHYHDERAEALAWLLATKSAQCRRNGWRDVFAERDVRELVELLLAVQGKEFGGVLSTLCIEGEITAAMFGLRSSLIHTGSIIAHNDRFARFHPGWICLVSTGEAAAHNGLQRLDLGDGPESFKQKLGNAGIGLAQGAFSHGALGFAVDVAASTRRGLKALGTRFPAVERAARQTVRDARRIRYRAESSRIARAVGASDHRAG